MQSFSPASLFVLLLGGLVSGSLTADEKPRPHRPNIVLIMADDLGFSDLGWYYGAEIRTPHLDQLARDCLHFSQFYNTARYHSSRASLLTGLYCDQAGSNSLSRGATSAEVMGPPLQCHQFLYRGQHLPARS